MVSALMAGAVLVAGCPATTVHYGETRIGTPWVAQKRITGHLFAYGGKTLMDSRVNASAGLVLYTRGRGPDGLNTKILWVVRGRFGRVLTLTARRLDATGSFSQRFPAQPRCESTVVGPDGVAATPTSSAIVGWWGWRDEDGRAFLYTNGRTPQGGNTKILWHARGAHGGTLTVVGTRLDAVGSFRQAFPEAESPPAYFPSIVNIPQPGCWLLTLRTEGAAGIVVTRAVPPT